MVLVTLNQFRPKAEFLGGAENARLENAELENAAPNCRTEKRETKNARTDWLWKAAQY